MRLSTWLIVCLSAAYFADLHYFDGAYSTAAVSVFRHVGIELLAGLNRYG
jgi:hypothetical protein